MEELRHRQLATDSVPILGCSQSPCVHLPLGSDLLGTGRQRASPGQVALPGPLHGCPLALGPRNPEQPRQKPMRS